MASVLNKLPSRYLAVGALAVALFSGVMLWWAAGVSERLEHLRLNGVHVDAEVTGYERVWHRDYSRHYSIGEQRRAHDAQIVHVLSVRFKAPDGTNIDNVTDAPYWAINDALRAASPEAPVRIQLLTLRDGSDFVMPVEVETELTWASRYRSVFKVIGALAVVVLLVALALWVLEFRAGWTAPPDAGGLRRVKAPPVGVALASAALAALLFWYAGHMESALAPYTELQDTGLLVTAEVLQVAATGVDRDGLAGLYPYEYLYDKRISVRFRAPDGNTVERDIGVVDHLPLALPKPGDRIDVLTSDNGTQASHPRQLALTLEQEPFVASVIRWIALILLATGLMFTALKTPDWLIHRKHKSAQKPADTTPA